MDWITRYTSFISHLSLLAYRTEFLRQSVIDLEFRLKLRIQYNCLYQSKESQLNKLDEFSEELPVISSVPRNVLLSPIFITLYSEIPSLDSLLNVTCINVII